VTRACFRFAISVILASASLTATPPLAAERSVFDGPQWPQVGDDAPQWPNVSAKAGVAQWPEIPGDEPGIPAPPPRASWPNLEVTGSSAQWPVFASAQPVSPFAFETGLRYWYSGGSQRFSFANMMPFSGDPTSSLDWRALTAHSGEVFARLDHRPTGFFVKGVIGLGVTTSGQMDDLDFLVYQARFSDTTSRVKGDTFVFGIVDVGYAFSPAPGVRVGGFVGYHYWREKSTAYGLVCNFYDPFFGSCPAAGTLQVGYDTAVISYEPTWHAVRIGIEGRMNFAERWSISGEVAGVPYAALKNKDSHLLRQVVTDLGPAPNIISTSNSGFGVEADLFVNYALTENIEIGAGVRYWGLMTHAGHVSFGPDFGNSFPLRRFDQQRYGLLFQVKGKF
jgi:outer membrane protease